MPEPDARQPSLLDRLILLRPGEGAVAALSGAYFFFLLFGYYLIRPVREAMGIEGGWDNLPWLMTGTLAAMALANPAFAAMVSRWPRRVFIPATYRFFAVNMLLFYAALLVVPDSGRLYLGYAFYIWVSVYNLFVVAVFWGFMADVFTLEQGKRLFGAIGVGGTLGAIGGAAAASTLVSQIGQASLLLLAIPCLEAATQCMLAITRRAAGRGRPGPQEPSPRALDGLRLIARSPYLQLICVFMLLMTVLSTFLYIAQGKIIDSAVPDRDDRTALFAQIDLWTNVLTLFTQAFFTARIIRWLGIGGTLAVLPALTIAGFTALAAAPTLAVLVAFQVARRGLNYGLTRPTREVLFTVLGPDEKYKSKSFIDTFVYRTGDVIGAWAPTAAVAVGWSISVAALPVAAVWLLCGLGLGVMQRRRTPAEPPAPLPYRHG